MENSIKENVLILMGKYMKEIGEMVNHTDKELKHGQMEENMMEIGEWGNQ
jgi:hypothetical protein